MKKRQFKTMKKIILTCTFIEVIYAKEKGGRRQLSRTPTQTKVFFEGKNKSDCLRQAKENFRNGVEWDHQFN